MLILVHRSSGKSFSCRRAATGISKVCACLSIAGSAILFAFGIMSIEPPRLSEPAIIMPPRVLLPRSEPQSATKTAGQGARRRSGAGGRDEVGGVTTALAEKSAQAGRTATGADQAPSVPESDARKSNPDSALATPPASCGDAAVGIPGGHRCAADCPLGCREETNDDRCSKDASGAMA